MLHHQRLAHHPLEYAQSDSPVHLPQCAHPLLHGQGGGYLGERPVADHQIRPGRGDFACAAALADVASPAVQAGDALHLAVVERIGATLATFDAAMARAAVEQGLDVLS